jgi:tRNA nucleotidyltransferase (CCA-adding enzyme)
MLDWLNGPRPAAELASRRADGRLAAELPEVDRLYGIPQPVEHHPEVDTGVHMELCLDAASRLSASPSARLAVLLHDLGKGVTDPSGWPSHVDHEALGVPLVDAVCQRFGVQPRDRALATLVCGSHLRAHRALQMRPRSVMALLESNGLVADMRMLDDFVVACESDARGRLGLFERPYPQAAFLRACAATLREHPKPQAAAEHSRAWQEWHKARLHHLEGLRARLSDPTERAIC